MYQLKDQVLFVGKDRIDAKRRALDYWYRCPRRSGLTLQKFLERCRLRDEHQIAFYPPEAGR